MERSTMGWAARDASGPYNYTLSNTGAEDIFLKVLYCGVCQADVHKTTGQGNHGTSYLMVPGHEVIGEVVEVGADVTKFIAGDRVGVGYAVGSCATCLAGESNIEQSCNKRIWSFGDFYTDGKPTHVGFAAAMVVNQKFAVKIPDGIALEQVASLLCAGVTVYSPLCHFGLKKSGLRGGILGLGGLGRLGVKIAKAMGHHITVISSSDNKKEEAWEHLGADEYLVSLDTKAMQGAGESLDYIIDTLPVFHPLDLYLSLLKREGKLILVGLVDDPLQFISSNIFFERSIVGSLTDSVKETEELLEFWKEKGMSSMKEIIKMDYINTAFQRLEQNDARYRFVVHVAGSKL